MASEMETAFREFLLDPSYWKPRLEALARVPSQLTVRSRPDLSRPGILVQELQLHAFDGARLEAFMARCAFDRRSLRLCLWPREDLSMDLLDPALVEEGTCPLVYRGPPERHLEERVLDALRVAQSACTLESVDCRRIDFGRPDRRDPRDPHDELVIARMIRDKGWFDCI